MVYLPKKVIIPEEVIKSDIFDEEISEDISDYLSEKYGYCHFGFDIEIKAVNITWDTSG